MTARRALVLGLGRFGGGLEATRFLLRHGHAVRVADRATAETLTEAVQALAGEPAVEWRLGSEDPSVLDGVDLLVVNPAIPPSHPLLVRAAARGIPWTQEVNLLLEAFPGRVVLVTGTNGKSTTATLLAAALRRSGIDALLGGNVGRSLLADEPGWRKEQVAVVEISSFQLERVDPSRHRVAGALLARITRDHLDRHGSLAAYHAAKAVAAATASDFLVHQADDVAAAGFASPARQRVRCVRGAPAAGEVGCVDGWITSALADPGPVLHPSALALVGGFHVENAMAAFAAATLLGASRHLAALAIAEQRPLRFRLQRLLVRRGVELWDNAVSTEVLSTLSALQALGPGVHWVAGGKSKDGDYGAVARAVAPYVASAHLFGAAARPLAAQMHGLSVTVHERVDQALDAAWSAALPGSRVLFSPAFASFDQYANFRQRGEAFHAWAARLRTREEECGTGCG